MNFDIYGGKMVANRLFGDRKSKETQLFFLHNCTMVSIFPV